MFKCTTDNLFQIKRKNYINVRYVQIDNCVIFGENHLLTIIIFSKMSILWSFYCTHSYILHFSICQHKDGLFCEIRGNQLQSRSKSRKFNFYQVFNAVTYATNLITTSGYMNLNPTPPKITCAFFVTSISRDDDMLSKCTIVCIVDSEDEEVQASIVGKLKFEV